MVSAAQHLEPASLAPVGAPRVTRDPVREAARGDAPAGHLDVVIHLRLAVVEPGRTEIGRVDVHALHQPRLVVHHKGGVRCEGADDRAACPAVLLDAVHDARRHREASLRGVVDVRGGGVGDGVRVEAVAALPRRVAHAVLGLVRLAGLVRQRRVHHVAVDSPGVTALAASGRLLLVGVVERMHAVHRHLAREHDVWELAVAGDLDAVVQRGDRAVDPAAAAVGRDVLVHVCRHHAAAIDVAPVEGGGDGRLGEGGQRGEDERRRPHGRALVAVVEGEASGG
eukprot:scaffold29657_cov54-Phaeocystis_antarctica.AAC.2